MQSIIKTNTKSKVTIRISIPNAISNEIDAAISRNTSSKSLGDF